MIIRYKTRGSFLNTYWYTYARRHGYHFGQIRMMERSYFELVSLPKERAR